MENNCNHTGINDAFLFLVGAGIGVGLGILLAPQSGRESRDAIREKVNDGQDYLARQRRAIRREVSQKATELADQASGLVDQGKETLESYSSSLAAAVDAGRQAYRETVAQKA